MSHEIDMTNDRANMAYVGDTPWHGLGQQLMAGASIETWQEMAGMDWTILNGQVQYTSLMHGMKGFDGQQVLYRSDTGSALSIVSDSYQIVQPKEVLEFYRDLVSDAGFSLETAGCLFGGRKFWALANVNKSGMVKDPRDQIKGRLLLSSSCDGTLATTAQFISERVVCNNTLQIGLKETGAGKVVTRHKTVFDPKTVKAKLGLIDESWDKFIGEINMMALMPVTTKQQIKQFLVSVFDGDMDKPFDEQPRKRAMQSVYNLSLNSPGADMAGKTVWGLLNGLTRFVDFERKALDQQNRLNNAWFGPGADLKEKGYMAALELCEV